MVTNGKRPEHFLLFNYCIHSFYSFFLNFVNGLFLRKMSLLQVALYIGVSVSMHMYACIY